MKNIPEALRHFGRNSQRAEISGRGFALQQPQHHLLPILRGQRRNAQVDPPPVDLDHEPAVLGRSPFGDVHVRQDFYARGDLMLQRTRNALEFP